MKSKSMNSSSDRPASKGNCCCKKCSLSQPESSCSKVIGKIYTRSWTHHSTSFLWAPHSRHTCCSERVHMGCSKMCKNLYFLSMRCNSDCIWSILLFESGSLLRLLYIRCTSYYFQVWSCWCSNRLRRSSTLEHYHKFHTQQDMGCTFWRKNRLAYSSNHMWGSLNLCRRRRSNNYCDNIPSCYLSSNSDWKRYK